MNYLDFRQKMFELSCFNINQIYAWQSRFDRNNLTRWCKKGLLIRLKQGYYTFPEYKEKPGFSYYFANRIYKPSYISLHTALSFYGIIPEAVVQITSVTSLKTAIFNNEFGEYSYKTIKKDLMFGYDLKQQSDDIFLKLAKPEKALLDLFYLYPFYNTGKEISELRLDEGFIRDELDVDKMKEFAEKFKNKAFEKRVNLFFEAYELW
jgi:predicted transcriptional regulator of viral defense system